MPGWGSWRLLVLRWAGTVLVPALVGVSEEGRPFSRPGPRPAESADGKQHRETELFRQSIMHLLKQINRNDLVCKATTTWKRLLRAEPCREYLV